MKRWQKQFFNKNWLQINEETVYRKLISNTKTLELGNLGEGLYTTKHKWESKIQKLVQIREEEIQ
jgi:hypothetical protein